MCFSRHNVILRLNILPLNLLTISLYAFWKKNDFQQRDLHIFFNIKLKLFKFCKNLFSIFSKSWELSFSDSANSAWRSYRLFSILFGGSRFHCPSGNFITCPKTQKAPNPPWSAIRISQEFHFFYFFDFWANNFRK